MAELTLLEAVNDALHTELARDDSVLVMGEDVGRAGGVFRATVGLRDRFGPDRCIDTPLAEAGMLGAAVGLCMAGLRPVCEMQYDAFSYPCLDQLITHVGRYRWRTRGAMDFPQGGGCQCGAVRYEITGPPAAVYACHCTECQRQSGSAFAMAAVIPQSGGELWIYGHHHGHGYRRLGDRRIVRNALGYPNEPIYDGLPAIPDYTVESGQGGVSKAPIARTAVSAGGPVAFAIAVERAAGLRPCCPRMSRSSQVEWPNGTTCKSKPGKISKSDIFSGN